MDDTEVGSPRNRSASAVKAAESAATAATTSAAAATAATKSATTAATTAATTSATTSATTAATTSATTAATTATTSATTAATTATTTAATTVTISTASSSSSSSSTTAAVAVAESEVADMDSYWKECFDIRQSKDSLGTEDSEDELSKTPDEGEIEAEQLTKIGLGPMVSLLTAEQEDLKSDEQTDLVWCSLTGPQRDTVRRWMDTLGRKKQLKTHVKDLFPNTDWHSSQSPPSSPTDSPAGLHSHTAPAGAAGGRNNNMAADALRQRADSTNRYRYFHRSKNAYSMDGHSDAFEIANGAASGIEMLCINPKQTWNKWAGNHIIGKASSLTNITEHDHHWFIEDRPITHTQEADCDSNLPNFIIEPREEGATTLSDLGPGDLSRLQCLAVIELSMLFDRHNIQDCPRKSKKSTRDHGVFGVALQTQLENDQKIYPNIGVPLFFHKLLDFLSEYGVHVEGILRVPGATSRIKILRNDLEEQFYLGRFDWKNMMPNDASALLKQFLRDLPDPLLTNKYRESFVNVQFLPTIRDRLKALNLLMMVLPDAHRNSLMLLLRFLKKVLYYQNENKMSLSNLAMIMAPNLFLSSSSKKLKNFKDWEISIAVPANIIKLMVNYIDILWTVPPSMIQQLRHRYQIEFTRKIKKLKMPGKKEPTKKSLSPDFSSETLDNMICIQVPHLSKSTRMPLFDTLSVSDVLYHVQKMQQHLAEQDTTDSYHRRQNPHHLHQQHQQQPHPPHHQFYPHQLPHYLKCQHILDLYEVGGNIGERCLQPSAMVSAVFRDNTAAEWVVRIR
ncbi:rho GTPase-activating protein 18-like [Argonauta hians]